MRGRIEEQNKYVRSQQIKGFFGAIITPSRQRISLTASTARAIERHNLDLIPKPVFKT